jgi:hypothetical protein
MENSTKTEITSIRSSKKNEYETNTPPQPLRNLKEMGEGKNIELFRVTMEE